MKQTLNLVNFRSSLSFYGICIKALFNKAHLEIQDGGGEGKQALHNHMDWYKKFSSGREPSCLIYYKDVSCPPPLTSQIMTWMVYYFMSHMFHDFHYLLGKRGFSTVIQCISSMIVCGHFCITLRFLHKQLLLWGSKFLPGIGQPTNCFSRSWMKKHHLQPTLNHCESLPSSPLC